MNIIVCVKQVPSTTEIKLDPKTHTIIRDRADNILNPFDTYAVEEAIRLKEKFGGSVTVISMGIPKAESMLREITALGADNAILLTDRKFAGSDTLATAYALSMAIKKIGSFDIIICGKQATDGDTAQVGPNLAEKLSIPHAACISKINSIENKIIQCSKITDEGYETLEIKLPALITVVKEINVPRLQSIYGFRKSLSAEIVNYSTDDIKADDCLTGLAGSPTQVKKTFVPEHNIKTEFITGSADEQAQILAKRLKSMINK